MGPPARPLEARALPKGSIPVDRPAMKPEAVVMRVTPALLDALRAAKASGVRATVRFGAGQSGNVRPCVGEPKGGESARLHWAEPQECDAWLGSPSPLPR